MCTPLGLSSQQAEIKRAFEEGRLSLDQKVLYQFYAQKKPDQLPALYRSDDATPLKCGTPAVIDFHRSRERLSPMTVQKVRALLEGQDLRTFAAHPSPSGKFIIHYETSGEHAVPPADSNGNGIPDYVELVAEAADSSYRHEVQTLGYSDPIRDGSTYDIEILNLENIFGQTIAFNNTTRIQIENDYSENFPPNDDPDGNQAGAVKATVAHELKHAIQFVATGWDGETDQWAEMDATLMEEVVYDPVNDYYNYLGNSASIFSNPQQSFYPGSYYHVSWALYFEEEYGPGFWPAVWDIIEANPDITMVDALTQQLGSPQAFNRAYIESQLWHYAAGPNRSADNFGFEERRNYPASKTTTGDLFFTNDLKAPRGGNTGNINSFSAIHYILDRPAQASGKVGVEVSSANTNTGIGVIAYFLDGTADIHTMTSPDQNPAVIKTDWIWSDIASVGIVSTNDNTGQTFSEPTVKVGNLNYDSFTVYQNFPNPFRQSTDIRFILEKPSQVTLKVYDIAGRLVTTLIDDELSAGPYEPTFDGNNLASGVYIYQLVTDRNVVVKKMTLIK